MRNKEFDLILNRMCRRFEENEFNPDEWSYGYDIRLTFAFSEYFNSLEDYQIAEEFEDGDEDLEKTVKLRKYFNERLSLRLTENHKILMSNLMGGMIYE